MTGPKYESAEENSFKAAIVKWGTGCGVAIAVIKLNLSGRRGWPDLIVLWEGGHIVFIEFKRPGERPRKLQEFVHSLLRKMGFIIEVHDDRNEALESIKAKIHTTTTPNGGDDKGRPTPWVPPVFEARKGQDSGNTEDLRRTESEWLGRCPTCHRPLTGDHH